MPSRYLVAPLLGAALLVSTPAAFARPAAPAAEAPRLSDRQALELTYQQLAPMAARLGVRDVRADLLLRGIHRDPKGQLHVRLDQHIGGVPVFGGQLIAHLDSRGALRSITDDLTPSVGLPSLRPRLTAGAALREARADFARGTSESPIMDLVLFEGFDGDINLTWMVHLTDIESDTPAERIYFIDAHSGDVVFDYDNLHTRAAQGDGESLYLGTVPLTTDSTATGYQMKDPARGNLYTTDMGNGTSGNGTLYTDADNHWGNGKMTDRATAAVDAHHGAMMTWDFYLEVMGREGIRNTGEGSLSRVHYGNSYNNAFWNDSCFCMTYGDGDGRMLDPLVALDVVGHEMTHGVTSSTSGLVYFWDAGGMNEGFSDIIGTAVEFYVAERGIDSDPDYLIGEDIYTPGQPGDAMRYMDDPSKDGRSIDHASQMRVFTDPHYSSGLPNNVFYLASHGGQNQTSGDRVNNPIGVEKAATIFYHAVASYMTPRARFTAQRDATVEAALDIYSEAEADVMSAAWSACGVD